METKMTAVELTGTIDEHRRLQLDGQLPIAGPLRVRVLVLYPASEDWDETEWLRTGARNPAFDYLRDSSEDVYSLTDGKPFSDQA
jgi:hypothetical protein